MKSIMSAASFVAFALLPFSTLSAVCAHPTPNSGSAWWQPQKIMYGSTPSKGPSVMSTTSSTSPFDGAKFDPRNGVKGVDSKAFDWWYFDAVSSTNSKQNVVVQFLTSNPSTLGLDGLDGNFFNWILLSGTYPNGTEWGDLIPAIEGKIEASGTEGSSKGTWTGSNCSWTGGYDWGKQTYSYKVSVGVEGMSGQLTMDGFTKPHYAHEFYTPLQSPFKKTSELLRSNFGWSNAIPSGYATADFTIAGERVKFKGWGYHDKNWGDKPTPQQTYSWYWGHAVLGDITLVWFDYTSKDIPNNNPTAVYLVQNGKLISMDSCKVRPYGKGVTYPPKNPLVLPEGYKIDVDAGRNGKWQFTAQIDIKPDPGMFYTRFTGTVTGGKLGPDGKLAEKDRRKGTGLWEWMYFLD